ncbi:unnamed protein product [Kuraishia capsulata CBS 1993]|uniref:Exportin-5 C-terminal domain-containing protein n=1 Tax=Kuraishia capsulata CBS 1993 TaxID=1382522 RepID=W6MJ06_9ASCO|nr:uncharacterized protein KUCA_T00002152001 [Kuraishia capsulata CBS 1993]CDK26181.1 unnamed protein product [Kuraishia capsulata CBS 1993]
MDANGVNQIVSALGVIYSSQSTNDDRRQAQDFLETVKEVEESPFWGYQLSRPDNKFDNIVRHFGLNLLRSAIARDFDSYDLEKQIAVRNWVVELATKVSSSDPHYLKEKVAFLWVAIAKRCWGNCLGKEGQDSLAVQFTDEQKLGAWTDMDSNLLELWNYNASTRELSLIIFRTLFEDVYLLDDPIVSSRNNVLSSLCPEVTTSERILSLKYEPNDYLRMFCASQEGWFVRWAGFLDECLQQLAANIDNEDYKNYTLRILQTLKTCLHWILPIAFREVEILAKLSRALMLPDPKIKTLATDCMHVLATRSFSEETDFDDVVGAIFHRDGILMLAEVYRSIKIDSDDIDEQEYSLLKKLVEMIVGLSGYLLVGENTKFKLPASADIPGYLELVLETTNHESLIISGLSLNFWCALLRRDELSSDSIYEAILPTLLDHAANRLLNYEDFDDENIARKYLSLDFDSQPDSHLFLSNYKKYMDDIVRIIVCKIPNDGLNWLESRLEQFFSSPLGQSAMASKKLVYSGAGAEPYIYGFLQFVLVEASVRGVSRWQMWYEGDDKDNKNEYLTKLVESLCERLLMLQINDPILLRKQIQTLVQFTPLLKGVSSLMFKVLERVMNSCTFDYPENADDDERELIRDLRTSGGTELNRLAYLMPDSLTTILDDLEVAIADIIRSGKLSDHESVAFKSFLLVVSQRSSISNKQDRFSSIVDPELAAWSDPATEKGLLELHWFMERLGIVKISEYFQSRGITAETNLLTADMDDTGRALKTELKNHWSSVFPIRATRIFIQYSIEKLDHSSQMYQDLLALWKPRIQPILPHILQLISQIQAYHDPANWRDLPEEVQAFVKDSCTERFWQQGVSIQSKDSFMEESVKAMHSLRDFADSVGHIVRYTREYAYLTISSISELEETLYDIPNIASLLWRALAGDSVGISLHSWRHMINLVLRNVIKNCPTKFTAGFLGELLPQVLPQVDALLTEKWTQVYQRGLQLDGNEGDESLSEEMMEEHMLRQLTAVVDRMLIDLVGQLGNTPLLPRQLESRQVIFRNKAVLAPFLQLLCHIIMFKDTRCSFNAILIIRNMLSDILGWDDEVDKYLCENLMKALLEVLTDNFFVDAHPEAGYALTNLYVSLRANSPYPAHVLQKLLPTLTTKELTNFEQVLISAKTLRQRRNAFMQLISKVKGDDDKTIEKDRKKQLESASKRKKKSDGTDVMDDPLVENGSLNTLFGDN